MGRRKERRAAASMVSGRRVKLDLFAEPSGEEKSNQVEGEGMDVNNNNRDEGEGGEGIPNSPSSSSGKPQENPLLLLGQYSDEEVNEEHTNVSSEAATADQIAQVEEFVAKECGNVDENIVESFADECVKQDMDKECAQVNASKNMEGNGSMESGSIPLDGPQKGEELTAPISDQWTYGMQNIGEVAFGWKLVMHEQTNQYYYWNIETGETSWEVPAIFAQGTELITEQGVQPLAEERESTPLNTDAACTHHSGPVVYSGVAANDQVNFTNEAHKDENVVYSELGSGVHQTDLEGTGNGTCPGSRVMDEYPLIANGLHEEGFPLSSQLVSYAENLVQRLKDLKSSDTQLQDCEWISKYILEVEIRLSDIRSLLVYGSSLLPFWKHSEEKLKVLEHAISDHISQYSRSEERNEVDSENIALYRDENTLHQSNGRDTEFNIVDHQAVVPSLQDHCSSPNFDNALVPKETEDISTCSDVNVKQTVPSVSSKHIDGAVEGNSQEVDETVLPKDLVPSAVEDEDMDVDMEVDEETTMDNQNSTDELGTKGLSPPENAIRSTAPGEWPITGLEKEYDVPPPPDEDWIPPPPPDAEPVPPPPPDDPPAPTYAPQLPYSETLPHLPYSEQYNISYPVSGSAYYGSAMAEVPSSDVCVHSEQTQAVESQSVQYLDTVSTTYCETTSVTVNPLDSSVYYELPNGTVPPLPAISCFEPSGFYGEPASVIYQDPTSDQIGTDRSVTAPEHSSLPNLKGGTDASAVSHETEMLAAQMPPISITVQATTTCAPVPSKTAASGTVSSSASVLGAAKVPTKVLRSKKRMIAVAPTLRSNKKVSSLVDKWKAAKEELHEDEEDEPQNAYEMLERKRQREIEQWRAHQIATGEAKDNANFQPLGGDWRERVKRKRGQSKRESTRTLPVAPVDGKQSPDLAELSSGLPSGWQAYWDESTNKAYYGNTITMETTWTRPTH